MPSCYRIYLNGRRSVCQLGDTRILLIRDRDKIRAYQAKYSHSGAPLEQGRGYLDGGLICPWHKAILKISDGSLLCEPLALSNLERYPVRVENGMVQVGPHEEPAVNWRYARHPLYSRYTAQ